MIAIARGLLGILMAGVLAGCAATPAVPDERDPFEGMNRAIYEFNDAFDRGIAKPVAQTYQNVVPQPVNQGVSNFFGNLEDVLIFANDLLQLKFGQAASDFSRVVWNTTVGLGGLIDVATHLELPKHSEDFGQTLGYWGVGSGPYLVLPFLGPSTLRDASGSIVDTYYDPVNAVEDPQTRTALWLTDAVDTRAGLLRASRVLEQAALDPYTFLRDAYLQRRENLVYDGNPPMPDFDPLLDDPTFDPLAPDPEPAPEPAVDGN